MGPSLLALLTLLHHVGSEEVDLVAEAEAESGGGVGGRVAAGALATALRLLLSAEFTLVARLNQDPANSGTLISFSKGLNRYLELQSSGRRGEIRLHYRTAAGVFVEVFPTRVADGGWHRVALSLSGTEVQLRVDCRLLHTRVLPRPPLYANFTDLALWLGRRNLKHSLLKGTLDEARIVGGRHGWSSQCPGSDTGCPTCGEFSGLAATVAGLEERVARLAARLETTAARLAALEACDCHKSCSVNGTVHADGATWQHRCHICSCVHGSVDCRPVQCPKLACKKPVLDPGECCHTCLKQCYLRGSLYEHGDVVSLKQCVECECRDGSMHCTRIDPETMCPPLTCPQHLQFSVPDECCKFCPGVDYCSKGHTCHGNASCLNLETTYACHCSPGFTGDGHSCTDIDECLTEGGVEGHHCRSNTRCHNTPGSYECHCLPGHRSVDRLTCEEIDECATGQHKCHEHALCVNTQGSYHCICLDGYTGDGHQCQRVCEAECENGGWCGESGECECRAGFTGKSCHLDVDECAADLHACHNTSACVNMPGWYYCTCAPGYMPQHQLSSPPICQDIDECLIGNHTCHRSAICVNNEGSFSCACPPNSTNCKLSCMVNGVGEIEDGASVRRGCEECSCSKGVVSCSRIICNCDEKPDSTCCPECDPASSCPHQEIPHLIFTSGQRWIYQCQTCECLMGEVDCWPVECAPVGCSAAVLGTSDCCPRCPGDDPCSPAPNASSPRPCPAVAHFTDYCPTCNCKEPFCDLLVSNMAFCVHRTGGCVVALLSAVAILLAAPS